MAAAATIVLVESWCLRHIIYLKGQELIEAEPYMGGQSTLGYAYWSIVKQWVI